MEALEDLVLEIIILDLQEIITREPCLSCQIIIHLIIYQLVVEAATISRIIIIRIRTTFLIPQVSIRRPPRDPIPISAVRHSFHRIMGLKEHNGLMDKEQIKDKVGSRPSMLAISRIIRVFSISIRRAIR